MISTTTVVPQPLQTSIDFGTFIPGHADGVAGSNADSIAWAIPTHVARQYLDVSSSPTQPVLTFTTRSGASHSPHPAAALHTVTDSSRNAMPPPASTVPQALSRKRKLNARDAPPSAPGQVYASSPSVSESSLDPADTDYTPSPRLATAAKRHPPRSNAQAGPGPSSSHVTAPTAGAPAGKVSGHGAKAAGKGSGGRQMSREALRKANHSLIERRRREKINAALGDLRDMVPGLGEAGGGKGGEFKLEVLERTVAHMRGLIAQVDALERQLKERPTEVSVSGRSSKKAKTKPSAADTPDGHRGINDTTSRSNQHSTAPLAPGPRKPSSSPPTPSLTPERSHPSPKGDIARGADAVDDLPDPNETDAEPNLPPPLTVASRYPFLPTPHNPYLQPLSSSASHSGTSSSAESASHPTISSLLATANQIDRSYHAVPSSRPAPPPQATNPTLYLPFPTPSPTSPFLSYGQSSSSVTSSATGPPEPSPFLAPLQGMPLFGGALSLDAIMTQSPADALSARHAVSVGAAIFSTSEAHALDKRSTDSKGSAGQDSKTGRDMAPEEAANVLLAFSSPDVMRPTLGMTPLMKASSTSGSSTEGGAAAGWKEEGRAKKREDAGGGEGGVGRDRRGTLDSEEFVLDGGTLGGSKTEARTRASLGHDEGPVSGTKEVRSKTAKDILDM